MAASPITDELSALEQARSRLEAALADDENWRALTQPGRDDDSAEARAARHARNTRLEMALADNAHYQAWKHVNGAIDALRARSVAQVQAAEPLVRPAAADEATRGSRDDLPEDVAALLRDAAPEDTPHGEPRVDADAEPMLLPAASRRPRALASSSAWSVWRKGPRSRGRACNPPRRRGEPRRSGSGPEAGAQSPTRSRRPAGGHRHVRRARGSGAPLLPSAELPSDLGTERNSALFDRLRSLDEAHGAAGRDLFAVQGQRRGSRGHHRLGGRPEAAPRGRGAGRHRASLPQGPVRRLGDQRSMRRASAALPARLAASTDRQRRGVLLAQPLAAE